MKEFKDGVEILEMQNELNSYIDTEGIDDAIEIIRAKLNFPKERNIITMLKYMLNNISLYKEMESKRHDILCFFIKSLGIREPARIPKVNKRSYTKLRSFDPAKNGQNILKHGVSFTDINPELGEFLTTSKTQKCERIICFSRDLIDESYTFIMSIREMPDSKYTELATEITLEVLDKQSNFEHSAYTAHLTYENLIEIIKRFNDRGVDIINELYNENYPISRFISARKFNAHNYENIIRQAMRNDEINMSDFEKIKDKAIQFMREIYHL